MNKYSIVKILLLNLEQTSFFLSLKVRKFSNDYFNVDTKFRRPGLELINAFAVQNPFLWGQYLLRQDGSYLTSTGPQPIQQVPKFLRRILLYLLSNVHLPNTHTYKYQLKCFVYRREQLKMQLVATGQAVKEKDFFCKSEFDTFFIYFFIYSYI